MQTRHWNTGLALFFIAASLLTLFIWIPSDIETGVLVVERRSTVVGDAMAPTAVAIAILIISIAVLLASVLTRAGTLSTEPPIGVSRSNMVSIVSMALILFASLAVMVWAVPLTVKAMQAAGIDVKDYRLLAATVPYKYIGFAVGGFMMVCGLIAWIEGRLSLHATATAIAAVVLLILVYDVPFDTLLLPPNGGQ